MYVGIYIFATRVLARKISTMGSSAPSPRPMTAGLEMGIRRCEIVLRDDVSNGASLLVHLWGIMRLTMSLMGKTRRI